MSMNEKPATANPGTKNAKPVTAAHKGVVRRLMPLLILAAAFALVFLMGWHKYLTAESLADHRVALKKLIETNYVGALLAYVAIYIGVVALSLPGALLLTITGGFLFGWMVGGGATVISATTGATIIFLIARSAIGETLAARAGPWVGRLKDGFQENALSYLLFLRLVPAFPFFIVNLVPAVLGVRIGTFVLGTFLGIIPATFAFSFAGSTLETLLDKHVAAYETCKAKVATGQKLVCKLDIDFATLVSRELLLAFAALGVVALIPILLKRIGGRRAAG
jgi:uncharacterized membrane protein YdjX (TVP38/TMEM64 family)